jgi:hypothetical protein
MANKLYFCGTDGFRCRGRRSKIWMSGMGWKRVVRRGLGRELSLSRFTKMQMGAGNEDTPKSELKEKRIGLGAGKTENIARRVK